MQARPKKLFFADDCRQAWSEHRRAYTHRAAWMREGLIKSGNGS